MIYTSYPIGVASYAGYQPQRAETSAGQASGGHTVANPTSATGGFMSAPMMMAPMTMMSPAYMMAYPQMMGGAGTMMAPGAVPVSSAGATGGSHVTANPTNAMAKQSSGFAGGFGGYGGMGMPMMGGFAMPSMMMSPVFMVFGFPMVFGGSAAQPPIEGEVQAPLEEPAVEVDAPRVPVLDVPDIVDIVDGEAPTVDVVPPGAASDDVAPEVSVASDEEAAPQLPTLPITQLDAEDFSRYRMVEKSRQQEATLSLELTTAEGDLITLDFSQIDSAERSNFRGVSLEGEQIKDRYYNETMERVVNMSVQGELNAEEQTAIDSVLSSVVDVVQQFFTGNVGQAVTRLKTMDFDAQQLSELSLNMSLTKSAQVSKAFHNGMDHLHDLKNRDGDIAQVLDFLASEQKRLIDMASDVLDTPSAARLVRSLVPPMLSDPFAVLRDEVAAGGSADLIEAVDDVEGEDD